ncbi:MAG: InlB B-repeat-containing protein, partial [Clostridia bacterium]|nr:InlB B-repeat-containing protein [Clostridia bacterium]
WFPNYLLMADGAFDMLTNGNKAIVEVKYKVTGTPNATHGTQIGIGNFNGGKGTNIYVRTSKKHTAEDQGKEFTLTSTFTVDNKYATKIAFSGGGDIEISSIVVHELPAQYINDYAVVTYMDGNDKTTEFVKKNTALKTLSKDEYSFYGWYSNKDLTGEAVTSVSSDTTVYAKWLLEGDIVIINLRDGASAVTKKYSVGDKINETPTKEGYDFLGWYKYSNYVGRPVTTATKGLTDLYAKWEEKNPKVELDVDLTKNTSMITTGKTAASTIALEGDKLHFDIYNYERQLASTSSTADTWFPAYYFKDSAGNWVDLEIGSTYELQVTYKILDVKAGDNIGLQIGFGADGQNNASRTRIKGYAVHKAEDEGKEFTYSVTYSAERFNVGSAHYPKLLFSGQGELEVLSVKIKRVLPIIKDTVIGVQTYEDYKVGTDTGVLGNKKGTEVSNQANHTSGLFKNKSLKLGLNTIYSRMSGNTIISLEQDGKVKPFTTEKGAAYRVTFYMYADENMNNLTWSVNSVDSTLEDDYLKNFYTEVQDKVSLKKGEWKEIVAYIPVLKGTPTTGNLLAIAVSSNGYDGKSVYIDDVKIEQLVDSEVILYDTTGGEELAPQRAFADQPFISFKEPVKNGYLFDGWYYDAECKKEAKVSDKFPSDKAEITLYAKWIAAPTTAKNFTAGSFDTNIYNNDVKPYENTVADMDSVIDCANGKGMTSKVAWVKDAGIYGNGNAETDGALAFCNDYYSSYNDTFGYNAIRLVNEDGTPFTVVKGERYTIAFDYIFASHKGLSYIIPVISEHSAYADIGYNSYQTLGRVSVMETDTDYLSYKQSFVAERTGYVYITLTGRDDNANVDTHCYEKVYVDNLSIKCNPDVTKVVVKNGGTTWYTMYGIKGEKFVLANAVKEGTNTFDGFYLDAAFTQKFDGFYPEEDTTIYVKLKTDKYDTPSDFSKPIVIDFEETELLEVFYRQSKYMTNWSREVENEWQFITNDEKNALSGKNYIKLNGFSHYWNQAKFALYDANHPENVMLLDKGGKYRVTVMVRCEDVYEAPVNMTISLENPALRHLLAENGNVKLEYVPEGDRDGYFMFVGDIEVSEEMEYYPSLAIRRNANDLQTIFIDTISVEKLRDCSVTFEENGGSTVEDAVVQIHDLVFDPGIPYKDGYVFDGWFADKDFSKLWDFDKDTVENDMTLYAKWSVEVLPEEDGKLDGSQDTEIESEKIDNGKAPDILDADKVIIDKDDDSTVNTNNGMQLWVIILIAAVLALALVAVVFVVIILVRRKSKKA